MLPYIIRSSVAILRQNPMSIEGAAIVLYSFKTETMTLMVCISVVQGNGDVASAVATILLAVTAVFCCCL